MYPFILTIHILAATIWVGGHILISTSFLPQALKKKDVNILLEFEKKYEKVGIPSLLLLVVTGLWMAFHYYKVPFMSFDSSFHRAVSLKLILLFSIMALAIHARFFIIPRLSLENLKLMGYHVIAVTILSILMLIVGVSFRFGGFSFSTMYILSK